jgi:uncharacterized membrane-anchored protein
VPSGTDQIIFHSFDEGYVSLDDWSTVDAAAILAEISANTEQYNVERRRQGIPELHVVGWLQPPTLDRTTATVYWAIEGAGFNNSRIVNSIALRLSRDGIEKLNWVTDKATYQAVGGQLDVALRAHSFDQGHQYSDHLSTDKIAGYGIAALVAAAVGVKVAKFAAVGGGAAVAAGAAKAGGFAALGKLLVLPFIALAAFARKIGRGIKRLFGSSTRA